ncbi:MAG: hypothetical protein IKL81_02370 [Clostridia bacterium]|nr:hypothetical protein [Clostridia bacterium]
MKKFIAILLMLAFVVCAVACNNNTDVPEDTTVEDTTVEDTTVEDTTVEDTTEEVVEPDAVMSYDEFAAADLETEVTVIGYVQGAQKYSEEYGNTSLYLQDENGAYFVYRLACTAEEYALFTEGTAVKVTGYKAEWSGEIEIIDAKFEIVEGNYVAEATDVTALLDTKEIIDLQNQKVAFKGMTVEASTDADGNEAAFLYKYNGAGADGDDLYFNVSIDGVTYTFTVESDLCGAGTDVYEAVKALNIGDVIDLEGFLYWYNGVNPHITAVAAAE